MISPVGYVLIPVALIFFASGRRPLLWSTIAFVPFTALQVIDIGVTTIAGYQFFGVFFVVRCLLDSIWSGSRVVTYSRANALAAVFLFVCFVSLSMAVVQAGTIEVQPASGGRWPEFYENIVPLRLSAYNFTQILFPIFGIVLFHYVVRELKSVDDVRRAINLLVWGALVVAGMSLAAGLLFTIGQGNVYWSVLSLSVAGPLTGVGGPEVGSLGQFFRTYTIAGEPGFTAITLLVGIGLVIGSMMPRQSGGTIVVRAPRLILAVLVIALLLNGSTTGYLGGALVIVWAIFVPWYVGVGNVRVFSRSVLYALGGIVLVGIAAVMLQVSGTSFYEWLIEYHVAKILGERVGSGQIRSAVTWYTLKEVFLASPILGVGYGSHLSLSLITFLLSNVGIVGFGVFLAFLTVVFRNVTSVAGNGQSRLAHIAFATILTFVPFFATVFVAKAASGMIYGLTWIIIALAEASYQVYRRGLSHQAT